MMALSSDLQQLSQLLQQTLSPNVADRKAAEASLAAASKQDQFLTILLTLLQTPDVPMAVRQSGAIFFKNYCRKGWTSGDNPAEGGIRPADRLLVKQHVLTLMMHCPKQVQAQLRDAVARIAVSDFPSQWQALLPEIIQKHLVSSDLQVLNGAMDTLDVILRKYRSVHRSEEVLAELKGVILQLQEPLLTIYKTACQQLVGGGGVGQVEAYTRLLLTACCIFYSLNVVDLPEYFEDHMQEYFEGFLKFLGWHHDAVKAADDDKPGMLEELKTQILENLTLYSDKYQEEFEPYVQPCVKSVWELLMSLDSRECQDGLVSAGVHFLSTVAHTKWTPSPFDDPNVLRAVCEKVVLPNITLRDSDLELFEDNPQEYIRRDIESADQDTRRRSVMELVKSLSKFYADQVTGILAEYVNSLLQVQSKPDAPQESEKAKDACVYLVIAMAVRSQSRLKGVVETTQKVDVADFFRTTLAPELTAEPISTRPIVRASAIKYLTLFRNQLDATVLEQILPSVCRHVLHEKAVVHTYAASCIERLLSMKEALAVQPAGTAGRRRSTPRLYVQNLKPTLTQVLEPLIQIVLTKRGIPENEYIMRCILRIFTFMGEEASGLAIQTLEKLVGVVKEVSANPSNPKFNHLLFETIATIVKITAPKTPDAVESILLPVLAVIVQQQNHDFVPYCFQILGVMLEASVKPSASYNELFSHLMNTNLWSASQANVPGVVNLLTSFFKKYPVLTDLISKHMQGVFERFQYCLHHRKLEPYAFELLNAIFKWLPYNLYAQHFQTLLTVLLSRLHTAKSNPRLSRDAIISLSFFTCHHEEVIIPKMLDKIQSGLTTNFLTHVWLPAAKTMSDFADKKVTVLALSRLCSVPEVASNAELLKSCLVVIGSLMGLGMENGTIDHETDEEEELGPVADGPDTGIEFEVAYARLHSTDYTSKDMVPEVKDVLAYVKTCLLNHKGLIEQIAASQPQVPAPTGDQSALQPLARLLQ